MENTKQNDFQLLSQYSEWQIKPEIKIGQLNFDTPICSMLKKYYCSDISKYICHQEAKNGSNESIYVFIMLENLLITNHYDFEGDPSALPNPITSNIDYKKIYFITMDITEKANRLQMQLIKNDTFASFDTEILTFKTQTYVFLFYHFIKQQMTRMWQKFFESKIPIPEPHIYQCHFFLKKKNRREKYQNRAIVMSDKFIFNTEYTITFSNEHTPVFTLLETKWVVAIESFVDMKIILKTPNMLKIGVNANKSKASVNANNLKWKNMSSIEVIFYCENDLTAFIFQCRRLFNLCTQKYIDVQIQKFN